MKRNLFALIFSFTVSNIFAQNIQLIDSLKSQLRSAPIENRFAILNDLAWEYRASYPDSTIYFATQAKQIANDIGLKKGLAKTVNFIGVAYNNKAERILAFQSYNEALEIASVDGDSVQLAYANINLGRLFFEQGLLAKAYEYYVKALTIFDQLNNSSGLAYSYQSLANLYATQEDYAKAEKNYLEALKIRLKQNDTRDIMAAFMYLGRLYQTNQEDDKAIHFLLQADSAGRVIRDEINLAELNTTIAKSYLNKDLFAEAIDRCTEGLNVMLQKKNILILPQAYLTLGQIKFKQNKFKEARTFFNSGLHVGVQSKDISSKMEAYFWLWQLAKKENNKTETLESYNQYLVLKDSIEDLELTRQVDRLQFQIEIERTEKENQLLKATSSVNSAIIVRQRLQNIILAILVGFAAVLGIIQWQNIKARRIVNNKLLKRNEELSVLNKEKDTLMSFVAHDLKGPMNHIQGVSNLLEMEGALNDTQRTYIKIIKDATLAEINLIDDLLDAHELEENSERQLSSVNIRALLTHRIELLQGVATLKDIKLELAFESIKNDVITSDEGYLNRIVDNLVSNATKFSPKGSTVVIKAATTEKHFSLSVKDNGPGFSDNDKSHLYQKFKKLSARPTAGESSNGLGLAIVKTLVDRLNGNIELRSVRGQGSEFIVTLPLSGNSPHEDRQSDV
jgi:signal transduction histidine kinase